MNGGRADAAAPTFATRLVAWQRAHGRHDLPWQNTRDPYRIWLSEVMLQQTQVGTVLAYYARFLAAFPDIASLAAAPLDAVLARWSGLGYYRRARHLHAAARCIVEQHGGVFPRDVETIARLPGVGRSTAAAIAAFAFGTCGAILDGNVKRVLARHRGVEGYPGLARVEAALWSVAEALLPDAGIEAYTQGLMDLGASVCARRNPQCAACPVATDCTARLTNRIDALPAPRPARVLPRRAVQMLLLEHAGEILLEKRAPTGVWGSLWCLPEVAGRGRRARDLPVALRRSDRARGAPRSDRARVHALSPHDPAGAHRAAGARHRCRSSGADVADARGRHARRTAVARAPTARPRSRSRAAPERLNAARAEPLDGSTSTLAPATTGRPDQPASDRFAVSAHCQRPARCPAERGFRHAIIDA